MNDVVQALREKLIAAGVPASGRVYFDLAPDGTETPYVLISLITSTTEANDVVLGYNEIYQIKIVSDEDEETAYRGAGNIRELFENPALNIAGKFHLDTIPVRQFALVEMENKKRVYHAGWRVRIRYYELCRR